MKIQAHILIFHVSWNRIVIILRFSGVGPEIRRCEREKVCGGRLSEKKDFVDENA